MLKEYTEELAAELEAFDRDLAKLSARVDEIDEDVYYSGADMSTGWLVSLRVAKQHIDSAWRSVQYAQANITE